MFLRLDSRRRVSIPASLSPASPGHEFEASFYPEEDVLMLRRLRKKNDWVAVFKRCPVPMDDFPPRSRQRPKRRRL